MPRGSGFIRSPRSDQVRAHCAPFHFLLKTSASAAGSFTRSLKPPRPPRGVVPGSPRPTPNKGGRPIPGPGLRTPDPPSAHTRRATSLRGAPSNAPRHSPPAGRRVGRARRARRCSGGRLGRLTGDVPSPGPVCAPRAAGQAGALGEAGARPPPRAPPPAGHVSQSSQAPLAAPPLARRPGVSQCRPPLPFPLRLRRAPGAPIQTDNAPRLSDQPMAGAGGGRRRGLRVRAALGGGDRGEGTGERGEGRGDVGSGEGGRGPSRSRTCPRPPRPSCFPVFFQHEWVGGATGIVQEEFRAVRPDPLNDGRPKPVPPAPGSSRPESEHAAGSAG